MLTFNFQAVQFLVLALNPPTHSKDRLEAEAVLKNHPLTAAQPPLNPICMMIKLQRFITLLELPNTYATAYYCQRFVEEGQEVPDLTLIFKHRQNLDPNRYKKIE